MSQYKTKKDIKMKFKKNDAVYYHPIIGGKEKYCGFLESDPWQLGHGEWVVHLKEMDPQYQKKYGKTRVIAASLDALELFPL